MFRDAAATVLSREGYDVLIATTAKEGLDAMRAAKGRIDVVVSEMNFKGEMNGPTLLNALRKIDQELKCIFVSGYLEDTLRDMLDKDEPCTFLIKPFRARDFVAKVEECQVGAASRSSLASAELRAAPSTGGAPHSYRKEQLCFSSGR